MTVTPEQAEKWLAGGGDAYLTRPDSRRIHRYALMMEEGRWKLVEDTIVIDDRGWLLNGRHRLWAVTLSGKSVEFYVSIGEIRRSEVCRTS